MTLDIKIALTVNTTCRGIKPLQFDWIRGLLVERQEVSQNKTFQDREKRQEDARANVTLVPCTFFRLERFGLWASNYIDLQL